MHRYKLPVIASHPDLKVLSILLALCEGIQESFVVSPPKRQVNFYALLAFITKKLIDRAPSLNSFTDWLYPIQIYLKWKNEKTTVELMVMLSQIEKFTGPTWGPPRTDRPQVGSTLATWTWLSGMCHDGNVTLLGPSSSAWFFTKRSICYHQYQE